MPKIEMYSTRTCPSCVRAKQLFQAKGIQVTEYKVDEDENKFKEMKLRTNGSRTVPAIFIDGTFIGGFDRLVELERAGELG